MAESSAVDPDGVVAAAPAPWLRPYIDGYLGYRQSDLPTGIHRGLPSRHLTFIASIGAPIEVLEQTDPRQAPDTYGTVLGGLQASAALVARGGDEEGVAIDLTPLGARAVLGVPAGALWNLSLEAGDLLGSVAGELRERLHATSDWSARFAICDEVLGRQVRDAADVVAPEVREAWRILDASDGQVTIGNLSDTVGWSRRHLSQRFTDEMGLSPKTAARVLRFDRARGILSRPDRPSLVDIALACGYYDQAHFTRDFTQLAGCPPTEWLASEVVTDPALAG